MTLGHYSFLGFKVIGASVQPSARVVSRFAEQVRDYVAQSRRKGLRKLLRGLNRRISWFGHQYKQGKVAGIYARLDKSSRAELRRHLKAGGADTPAGVFREPGRFPENLAYSTDALHGLGLANLSAIKADYDRRRAPAAPCRPIIVEAVQQPGGLLRLVLRAVRAGAVAAAMAAAGPGAAALTAQAALPIRLEPPEDAACFVSKTVEVAGSSMVPLFKPGEEMLLLEGYYNGREPERFDVVAYHYAGRRWPLMKIAYAVAGDHWDLADDGGGWRIRVEGRELIDGFGRVYRVPKGAAGRLKLSAQSYPTIPPGALLILGLNPSGSVDSAHFGLVDRRDLAGRLVRPRRAEPGVAASARACRRF